MKVSYARKWSAESAAYNASSGFEIGRRDTSGVIDWFACDRWRLIGNIISFSIQVESFQTKFRFYHPNDWTFYALKLHPSRG
jgi:hypothetical protein